MTRRLIESHAPSRVVVLHRPGANAVSASIHAVLIAFAIPATRTTPSFATKPPIEHVVHTEPVPPPPHLSTTPSAPSSSNSRGIKPRIREDVIVLSIEILVVITDVANAPVRDMAPITIVRRSGGTTNGAPGGNACSTCNAGDVRDALIRAHFKCAEADGQTVRQFVQQPFVFSLAR